MDILGDSDSDSFCYDIEEGSLVSYTEGERGKYAIGSAYTRRKDVLDIDCLTPENLGVEQNSQTEIQLIKQWKSAGRRPDWSEIAQYGPE